MSRLILCLVAFLLATNIVSSQVIFTTVPDTADNVPTYIITEEGTLNVSLYCEVISGNIQVLTRWLVKRPSDSMPILTEYNINGELTSPDDLMGKIRAIGNIVPNVTIQYQTNFTIVNFTSEFNPTLIKCGPQGTVREFNLGFPGIKITS